MENQEPRESQCQKCRGCRHDAPRSNLSATDWLASVPIELSKCDLVEVKFKNTRKGFFRNVAALPLTPGDMVVVDAAPGYDVGEVAMTGPLVKTQIRRSGIKEWNDELAKKIFRKAKPADLERYEEVKALEHSTMIEARKIAEDLGLNMKIGDVEYQGDGNKAIFYYIADDRVDFRQLIRVLADRFKVRIEMKQIGARQEAGRIGGIGPCGRPLCCATWKNNFASVTTAAARYQDLALNLQKLAGQCAKLKCCLNYEVDTYMDLLKDLPDRNVILETEEGTWYPFKVDIFKKEYTFSSDKKMAANLVTIDANRVFEIIEINKRGEKPRSLMPDEAAEQAKKKVYNDILEEGNLNRFDNKKKKKKNRKMPSSRRDDQKNGPQK
ncbi:MAG: hypothetical protein J1E99_08070 [Muribaculaceae bacterium]|nr:hypothetical protein [Muribaculaceae bacterium]